MINGEYKIEEFNLEVTEDELFLTHPQCAFVSSFSPKFPPYHYIKLLEQELTKAKRSDYTNCLEDASKLLINGLLEGDTRKRDLGFNGLKILLEIE